MAPATPQPVALGEAWPQLPDERLGSARHCPPATAGCPSSLGADGVLLLGWGGGALTFPEPCQPGSPDLHSSPSLHPEARCGAPSSSCVRSGDDPSHPKEQGAMAGPMPSVESVPGQWEGDIGSSSLLLTKCQRRGAFPPLAMPQPARGPGSGEGASLGFLLQDGVDRKSPRGGALSPFRPSLAPRGWGPGLHPPLCAPGPPHTHGAPASCCAVSSARRPRPPTHRAPAGCPLSPLLGAGEAVLQRRPGRGHPHLLPWIPEP